MRRSAASRSIFSRRLDVVATCPETSTRSESSMAEEQVQYLQRRLDRYRPRRRGAPCVRENECDGWPWGQDGGCLNTCPESALASVRGLKPIAFDGGLCHITNEIVQIERIVHSPA